MPKTKNPYARLKIIDRLLSQGEYSSQEIWSKVNSELELAGKDEIDIRTIQDDLKYLKEAVPVVEIGSRRAGIKYRYEDRAFSIFVRDLSDEEKDFMSGLLDAVGKMGGLEGLDWVQQLQAMVKRKDDGKPRRELISFSSNPYLRNSNYLGKLFRSIVEKRGIKVKYRPYGDVVRELWMYPYLLKQYSDRWYLVAMEKGETWLGVYPLDRIDWYEEDLSIGYVECDEDKLKGRFEDIIGVSDFSDEEAVDITCWMSKRIAPYVETKPLHWSQRIEVGKVEMNLRNRYSALGDGRFVTFRCKYNNELVQSLLHYSEDLIVVSPKSIRDRIGGKVAEMNARYKAVEQGG